jgi:hypothetical protein
MSLKDISSNISTKATSTMLLCLACMIVNPRSAPTCHSLQLCRKEDLGLYGNQLNYMQTCWTIGYVIGEIPSNIILTRIRPSIWIPAMEVSHLIVDAMLVSSWYQVTWAVLTFCLSRANSAQTLYALRFLIGKFAGRTAIFILMSSEAESSLDMRN